jgi:hypothetical protein
MAGSACKEFVLDSDQVDDQDVIVVPLFDEGDLPYRHYDPKKN